VPELSKQAFEDFQGKYDVMVGANSRALCLARRAESRRISHNNPGVREAENNQQCNRWSVPEYREQEQSVNTNRGVIARLDPEYRAHEQFANTER
jgi:hypothetical protein